MGTIQCVHLFFYKLLRNITDMPRKKKDDNIFVPGRYIFTSYNRKHKTF